jgi:hypothetical protein
VASCTLAPVLLWRGYVLFLMEIQTRPPASSRHRLPGRRLDRLADP